MGRPSQCPKNAVGRPLRSPGKVGCFVTAVVEAFALGTASGADRSRYAAPADDRRAAQAGSPAGTAVPAAADHRAGLAGRRATAVAAGSKVAAAAVAMNYPCSSLNSRNSPVLLPG